MGCHFLLQGIFLIKRWTPRLLSLLHCRQILYHWASEEALWTYAKCQINIYWRYGKIMKTVKQFTKCTAKRQQKLKIVLKIFTFSSWIYAFCYLFIVPILLSLHIWTQGLDFPDNSYGKEFSCNAGDPGLIPGLGRSPGEGNGYPLQYSCLENSMDRRTWRAMVHGVKKNQTRLNNFYSQLPT